MKKKKGSQDSINEQHTKKLLTSRESSKCNCTVPVPAPTPTPRDFSALGILTVTLYYSQACS